MEDVTSAEEKEKRRKKQYKRIGKILGHVWKLDDETNFFQERSAELQSNKNDGFVLSLSDIGQKVDSSGYRVGRHGWEDFARDLGGVYNFFINATRRSKADIQIANEQLDVVKELLSSIDKSLAKAASEHCPKPTLTSNRKENGDERSKKRKLEEKDVTTTSNKNTKYSNKNSDLADREKRAMEQLCMFIEEHGGDRSLVSGFRSRVTKTQSNGKFDIVYFNEKSRRFRSMLEVGRFLKLVKDNQGSVRSNLKRRTGFRPATSKDQDNEKKNIRKELDKLRKAHNKAMKSLDDYFTNQGDTQSPVNDGLLFDDDEDFLTNIIKSEDGDKGMTTKNGNTQKQLAKVTRSNCAAACVTDIDGFASIPAACTPDLLLTWDFLCTFERALSLTPIALDDFATALVYVPPEGRTGDDVLVPPVYLAEAHLSILKLLLQDRSSDDWWWSTLESNEVEQKREEDFDEIEDSDKNNDDKPVIKMDIAAALKQVEDPLITTSWMRALETVRRNDGKTSKELKISIKTALKIVSNKWVGAYLRKCLDLHKSQGLSITKRAISWLVDTVLEARPDLGDRAVHKETVNKATTKVIETATKLMDSLEDSAPCITVEGAVSDFEYEDDSDDESDDDEDVTPKTNGSNNDDKEVRSSSVPPKPHPSLVDLLLPPAKPKHNSDFVDAFTWSHVVGAAASRFLHRKKRVLNEIDDIMRDTNLKRPLSVSERREREKVAAARLLTECSYSDETPTPLEQGIEHLCSGGNYLDLSPLQRLALFRLLIEASYDTGRVHEIVSENYKQRANAMKALEQEQRRAKKEAKDKVASDEAAAREQLAVEAREKFLDDTREEIRVLNKKTKEFSDDIIESLTEEDIIDFDEDIRADYDALPGPESFSKNDVAKMILKMRERTAFDADEVRVLTMKELLEREKVELEEMEGQLSGFVGEDGIHDGTLDKETLRSIERLQRDIEKAKSQAEKLPLLREKAIEQLHDAIENGTIKVLRTAFTNGKRAKLCGIDDETGGVWSVDMMRDAALELENAKQNKRLQDAQKDLVAKLKKCFIRTDPIGRDRFGNRFWTFESSEVGHTWVEAEFILSENDSDSLKSVDGFSNLVRTAREITVGSNDVEDDFLPLDELKNKDSFLQFSRREYHSSGTLPSLVQLRWGCHVTEDSLRAVIKNLDSRGIQENGLKDHLKESIEHIVGSSEKSGPTPDDSENPIEHVEMEVKEDVLQSGDEEFFLSLKESEISNDEVNLNHHKETVTAIGAFVRVRKVLDESKNPQMARYVNGKVTGWKLQVELIDEGLEPQKKPVWRAQTELGHIVWMAGDELLQSMNRYRNWKLGHGYFENDAAFFAYRNNLGRHCGKAADAPISSSPFYFAKVMLKREAELYPKLKVRSFDNSWGGQSGARALWTNSMKDYAYDFETARQGLLTLENAFYELTDKGSGGDEDNSIDGKRLLDDLNSRFEIELESMGKNQSGLWNSTAARSVFLAIVKACKTTGVLALALDLLVRNTTKYLLANKLMNVRGSRSRAEIVTSTVDEVLPRAGRSSRRMNAWQQQQAQQNDEYDDSDEDWS